MGKLLPKFRRKIVQQAAETASNFVNKYYIRLQFQPYGVVRTPEKWIQEYEIHFALNLYLYDYAPRAFQQEYLELNMEWIAYFWVIMEFYALQFEKRFSITTDPTNPFSVMFEPNHSQRPLIYVQRLIECVHSDDKSNPLFRNLLLLFI